MSEPEDVSAARLLAEFLAQISDSDEEEDAGRRGVEAIAELLDTEVVAYISGGRARFAVGITPAEAVSADAGVSVDLEVKPAARLVVARRGEPISEAEMALVRGMGTALGLCLRGLHLVAAERRAREASERRAEENLSLLGALGERQTLLERMASLQRSIVDGSPLYEVLQTIAEAASELIGDGAATLRLLDLDDREHTVLAASVDGDPEALRRRRRSPVDGGIDGTAIRDRRLAVVDADADPESRSALAAQGFAAAMAAPIDQGGATVGSLAVSSRRSRDYGPRDQGILVALAEHASLALNQARAIEDAIHESLHDSLTGLPNRELFGDRLRHAVARAERSGRPAAVLFCDLDGFKTINDSLGPSAGDQLLVEVGRRIEHRLRPADTVARLGGDEFAVLLEEVGDRRDAVRTARQILKSLEAPIEIADREVYVGASIGIAIGGRDPETLLRNADLAMYRAKARGRGRYAIFEPQMHTAIVERMDLEVDLKRAIERDELILAYQPIYALRTGAITGLEALVRWRHPTRGLVVPARFVPLAEESGQIAALGRWVLATACRQAALWRAKYPAQLDLQVSVNISGVELREPGMVEEVATALRSAGLDPESLTLEITETALMENSEASVDLLESLKDLGVALAVDDFGTGYSSLRYLQRFPIDALKVDRFFIDELGREPEQPALLRAMVDLAENFGVALIAEGIEQAEQRDRLLALGCELGQGNLMSPAVPVEEADALLLAAGLLSPPQTRDPASTTESPSGDAAS